MTAIVYTQFSKYEVDTENKRTRRLEGVNSPTPSQGDDGAWKDYLDLQFLGNSLLFTWVDINPDTGSQRGTRTSDIVKIEGDLDVPGLTVKVLGND